MDNNFGLELLLRIHLNETSENQNHLGNIYNVLDVIIYTLKQFSQLVTKNPGNRFL